ncbi:trna splicing endonuclease subunit [Ophiostoma piceae UAMH 11346]|uniref:Trna splicing endonuclease subunit n=1 Tax=Ophiostoma piceae (strain UAMH 11346) TaxID=1262450 RepID=S3CG62_OPHP1|nr:trna splicing endonuclease subunit [Ophiostoma piceae UAMH 11346]
MSISSAGEAVDTASPPDSATTQGDAGVDTPFASAGDDGLDEEGLPVTERRDSSTVDADSLRHGGEGPRDGDDDDIDADEDANEEIQDYRGFAALVGGAKGAGKSTAAGAGTAPVPNRKKQISSQLIRKGEKDFEEHGTRAQRDALEQSRSVMESVLAHTRVHSSSGPSAASASNTTDTIRGWYFPDAWADEEDEPPLDTAAAAAVESDSDASARRFAHTRHRVVMVEAARGTMFASVGVVPGRPKWIKGLPKDEQPRPKPGFDHVWLLPEEALLLVERGSMELWYPLKSIEAILGSPASAPPPETEEEEEEEEETGIPLSLQAAYSLLIGPDADPASGDSGSSEQSRGRIPLPSYQVYTHLRRSGYQVLRAVRTDPQTPLDPMGTSAGASASSPAADASPVTNIWQWLCSLVGMRQSAPGDGSSQAPLFTPGIYRSYEPIYAQLRLASPPSPPAASSASSASSVTASPFRIVFHVWKAGKQGAVPFSKARPPAPDFYMAVADAHTTGVPTLDQITALLASVPPLPPPASPSWPKATSTSSFPPLPVVYRRLKLGRRCVIVSVVDHGIVNYMRFADGTFGAEPLYPRFDAVASGKFAGRGGGGKHGRGGRGGRGAGGKGGRPGGKTAAPKNK